MQLDFLKYQALGNNFVIIDVEDETAVDLDEARRLCDQRFGIGADGVLLVTPSSRGAARMIVLNADGSRPEMCGNGLRCVALYLAAQKALGNSFNVETDAGVLKCEVGLRNNAPWIQIDLGRAQELPALLYKDADATLDFRRISTGNPHAILFDAPHDEPDVDRLGPLVSKAIDGGANIEFVQQTGPSALAVIVWERGVGRTSACGTGAAAVAAAAARENRVPFDEPVEVTLPGGTLEITVAKSDLTLHLAGPAQHVFSGTLQTKN